MIIAGRGFEETGRQLEDEKPKIKAGPVEISGEVQLRAGFTPQNAYWKRANFNLNERSWRMLSSAALDRKENTYDPRIYDRLRVDLDTDNEEGFNFHGNIMVDPWSFTGRSELVNLFGSKGDWRSSNYTIGQIPDIPWSRLLIPWRTVNWLTFLKLKL